MLESDQPQHFAAIDLGSNSFHLVIVRAVKGDLQILFKHKERVRLASGLNEQSILSQEAIQRGVDVLQLFGEQLSAMPECQVMAVATHTLRQAVNRHEFLAAAYQVFPYPIDIISGQEEARLIYQGVAHDEQLEGNTLVIDIGGGSTEIVIGHGTEINIARSHQMGCVSFTHQFFSETLTESQYRSAKLAARQRLERFEEIFRRIGWQHVRLSSGTGQAVIAAAAAIDENFDGLTKAHIVTIKEHLLNDPEHPIFTDITAERVGILAAGLAILEAIYDALNIQNSQFSTSALREGLLYEAMETDPDMTIRDRSCQSLMSRYHVDEQHAERVTQSAATFWQWAKEPWQLSHLSLKFLKYAAKLHEVGLNINSSGLHKHSAYIVANSNLPGFSFEQQQLVASLIRQHRKRLREDLLGEIQLVNTAEQQKLICLLRLAVIWHLNRHPEPAPLLPAIWANDYLEIEIEAVFAEEYPLLIADLLKESATLEEADGWPRLSLKLNT